MIKYVYCLIVLTCAGIPLTVSAAEDAVGAWANLYGGTLGNRGFFPVCNVVYYNEDGSYAEARSRCSSIPVNRSPSTLATITDEKILQELKLAQSLASELGSSRGDEWVWSGLEKVSHNTEESVSNIYDKEDWKWTDGSILGSLGQWDKNYPITEISHGEECDSDNCLPNHVTINREGVLHNDYDYNRHSSVCQYDNRYIISSKQVTWSEAKSLCESVGLQLAVVTDADLPRLKATMKFFLNNPNSDSHPFDAKNWIWIGGTDQKEEGVWSWAYKNSLTRISDEIFSKLQWRKIKNSKKSQPDNAHRLRNGSIGQHVLAVSLLGEFDDSYDDPKRKRGFACQCPLPT